MYKLVNGSSKYMYYVNLRKYIEGEQSNYHSYDGGEGGGGVLFYIEKESLNTGKGRNNDVIDCYYNLYSWSTGWGGT